MKRAAEVVSLDEMRARLAAISARAAERYQPERAMPPPAVNPEIPARHATATLGGLAFAPRLREWAANTNGRNALLWGIAGVGKSWAAAALLREYFEQRGGGYFIEAQRLAEGTRDRDDLERLLDRCRFTSLLVIDDLGAEWVMERVDAGRRRVAHILMSRHEAVRPTLVTTNLRTEQLAGFDARIASALRDRHQRHRPRSAAQWEAVRCPRPAPLFPAYSAPHSAGSSGESGNLDAPTRATPPWLLLLPHRRRRARDAGASLS